MKKITLAGRECTMTCNMRALTMYQRMTGANPFELDKLTEEQKAMYDITVGWCMLSKEDQDAVSIDELMESIDTMEKQAEFSHAVANELMRFYKSEPGDADKTDRHDNENDNDDDSDKYEKKA